MIYWNRDCFSCDKIRWATFKCATVSDGFVVKGQAVKLVHPNGKCLSLPSAGTSYAGANHAYGAATVNYGVDEQLQDKTCIESDDQKFYLYEEPSPKGNIKLRPVRSVKEKGLNICVASNRRTWDCNEESQLAGGVVLSHPTTEGAVLESGYLIKMTGSIPTIPGMCEISLHRH